MSKELTNELRTGLIQQWRRPHRNNSISDG